MKIKNYEKFISDLFKNIKIVSPLNCDVTELLRIEYRDENIRPENKSICGIRTLNNPLLIERIHYDDNYMKVIEERMFIRGYEDGVRFFTENEEKQCFEFTEDYGLYFEDYPTQTSFMMDVAMKVQKFSMKGEE